MKKEAIVLLLLGILLVSPLVLAQEQSQTYSGFNRFIDNVKLFFSSGDKNVMIALGIREKESNDVATAGNSNEDDDSFSNEAGRGNYGGSDSNGNSKMTGEVISSNEMIGDPEEGFGGPSAEDSDCLYNCVVTEGKEESVCMTECSVEPEPEPADEGEVCMQKCIVRGCDDKYDIKCQNENIFSCENECGMIKEPEAQNEAEQCIRDCINEIDPNIECSHGTFEGEGETGNGACQKCAKSCEYLYAGPCLTDELWIEIEGACMAQGEHMETVPIMGDSGEGYECTIDLECFDRSDEVGDNPGSGPGIGQEGYVAPNVVAGAMDGVIKFFKGIFGNGNNEKEIEKNNEIGDNIGNDDEKTGINQASFNEGSKEEEESDEAVK